MPSRSSGDSVPPREFSQSVKHRPAALVASPCGQGATPDSVAISEAVQLASELSTEESPAFVNGVLRAVADSRVA